MRRLTGILAVVAAALTLPAPAGAAPAQRAVLVSCSQGLEAADRVAVFEGRMRARPGTAQMRMRFSLRVRERGRLRWGKVEAAGLGEWVTSDAGVERYVFTKRVERLPRPASYRMTIRFQWLDAAGAVIATRTTTSRPCHQPDLRPNLRLLGIAILPGDDPARARYVVPVRNSGRTASEAFDLVLTVNGTAEPVVEALALEPGQETRIELLAPRCAPGSTVSVQADASGAVDEQDELDNGLWLTCPA